VKTDYERYNLLHDTTQVCIGSLDKRIYGRFQDSLKRRSHKSHNNMFETSLFFYRCFLYHTRHWAQRNTVVLY